MRSLVVNRSSVSVKLEGNHLVVSDLSRDDATPQCVPLAEIDRVIVFGLPSISFRAMAKIMDMRIPCAFLSSAGRWRGMIDAERGYHAERRVRQYASCRNSEFATTFARRVIRSKMENCRRTIQRFSANRRIATASITEFGDMEYCMHRLAHSDSVDEIRGIEGRCAACYFSALSRFFPTDMPYLKRTRRPPRDPANALLSFVYTLLEGDLSAIVRAHGLDVSAGYFHRGHDRAPALALDLLEPFRPHVADRLVLDLINHRRVRADRHFELRDDGGTYLTDEGRAIVFKAYDAASRRRSEAGSGRLTLRQRMDRVVCGFLKFLENEEESEFHLDMVA